MTAKFSIAHGAICVAATLALHACSASAQTVIPVPPVDAAGPLAISGQPLPENRGTASLWQLLKELHTWGSVMTIVAHPDDEDGGMLAYESRGLGVRTSILTLTRGEGGQNAMSGAAYDALGLIRTNELLNADSYYGGGAITQYFGTEADYGFSKTMDEALSQWGHDRVLYDAVRAVRMERPLVVTSSFVGGITDGHGHHQVAGLLAQEVFKYAGDPNYYPDQIAAGLRPWKPLKIYARTPFFSITPKGMFDYATGKWSPVLFHNYIDNTDTHGALTADVTIPAGTYDPVLGQTYAQIARMGLGQQRTQHEGPVIPLAGDANSTYHRFASSLPTPAPGAKEFGFFDGIDTTLPGLTSLAHADAPFLRPALEKIASKVAEASLNYIPSQPENLAPILHDGYQQTAALIDQIQSSSLSDDDKANLTGELNRKLVQFNDALVQALGLHLAAFVQPGTPAASSASLPLTPEFSSRVAVPGSDLSVRLHVSSARGARLTRTALQPPPGQAWPIERLGAPGLDDSATTSGDAVFKVTVPQDAQSTQPYFSRPSIDQPFYNIEDPRWLSHPFAPYPLTGNADFDYQGVPLHLHAVVETSQMLDGFGAVNEPLLIAPALSLTLDAHAGIVPLASASGSPQPQDFPLSVALHSNAEGTTTGSLRLQLPQGWTCSPPDTPFTLAGGESHSFAFRVHPTSLSTQTYSIKAEARSGNLSFSSGYVSAGYPGIRPYNLFSPAAYQVKGVDVRLAPSLRVGYIMGTGDDIPAALTELGASPRLLSPADILSGDLSLYDTIVIGIRAYSSRPELATATPRLLAWVHDGGNLVVQYQGTEFDHDYAPYPYTLGSIPERVVNEKDPVTITNPSAPLLNYPNRITPADFDGWVEERGHSFMKTWSPRYTTLTETHDPDQDPQKGGLLYASYGKGTYIYVAFALYRQTAEGVPGAFRLLANLVSAAKAPTPAGR